MAEVYCATCGETMQVCLAQRRAALSPPHSFTPAPAEPGEETLKLSELADDFELNLTAGQMKGLRRVYAMAKLAEAMRVARQVLGPVAAGKLEGALVDAKLLDDSGGRLLAPDERELMRLCLIECAQCQCDLELPDDPPHCMDCDVDDEHFEAWEDAVRKAGGRTG